MKYRWYVPPPLQPRVTFTIFPSLGGFVMDRLSSYVWFICKRKSNMTESYSNSLTWKIVINTVIWGRFPRHKPSLRWRHYVGSIDPNQVKSLSFNWFIHPISHSSIPKITQVSYKSTKLSGTGLILRLLNPSQSLSVKNLILSFCCTSQLIPSQKPPNWSPAKNYLQSISILIRVI